MCVVVLAAAAAAAALSLCYCQSNGLDCAQTKLVHPHHIQGERNAVFSRWSFFSFSASCNIAANLQILTEYDELQNVIPNLVVNDVLDLFEGDSSAKEEGGAEHLPEEVRCANLSKTMKGSLLRQVRNSKPA